MKGYPNSVRNVTISDPYILADPVSKKYYLYSARFNLDLFGDEKPTFGGRFFVMESPDLINWSVPKECFNCYETGFWGDKDYWAPECHYYKGKYYIFSSFRADGTYRRCQALVADSPFGPFKPIKNYPVTPEGWQCLDASLYVDRSGKPYMIFCHEWTQVQDGQICAIELSDDLGDAVGDPYILFRASDAKWRDDRLGYQPENKMTWINGFITDGCYAHRMEDGTLIMLWSNFGRHGYTVAYARSKSGEIWGPWEQEDIPLYVMDGGHAMMFRRHNDNQLMMSFHAPNHPHDKKRMLLFEMEEKNGKLYTLNECTGNWFNIDKFREPVGYYSADLKVPPAFSKYASAPVAKPVAPVEKKEEKTK